MADLYPDQRAAKGHAYSINYKTRNRKHRGGAAKPAAPQTTRKTAISGNSSNWGSCTDLPSSFIHRSHQSMKTVMALIGTGLCHKTPSIALFLPTHRPTEGQSSRSVSSRLPAKANKLHYDGKSPPRFHYRQCWLQR